MDELTRMRIERFEALKARGDGQFPYSFETTHTVADFLEQFDHLVETGEEVAMAGRVMFRNRFGRLIFMRIFDDTGKLQWVISKQEVGEDLFQLANKQIDIGDICAIRGTAFETKTGEKSVRAKEFTVLGKNIRALPEKYHSLKDKETRYRQRELDLIMNRDSFEVFQKRSRIISFIRNWMTERGFADVETPTLQLVYGGGEACPFMTHVNAIDQDVYLGISPELYLKRLVVGGFSKVFTICKNFRNEGIDATHNPEFTMMEAYQAYVDYNHVMALAEQVLHDTCVHVNGTVEVPYGDKTLSFALPFKRLRFFEALEEASGLNRDSSREQIVAYIQNHPEGGSIDTSLPTSRLVLKAFELAVEVTLDQPTFVIDYPKESSPLCRPHRKDPDLIERFELFIAGMEIGNAYSELNDPVMQRNLLTQQSRMSSQDAEIPPEPDEYFMQAIEYAMPPTGGLGIGIDRVVMLLTNSPSIRDVIAFPFMRREAGAVEDSEEAEDENEASTTE